MPTGGWPLVSLSMFLGLSAGVFEETTRYLAYRYRLTSPASQTFKAALMFGTGHGGIESILLVGVGGIAQLIGMTVLRDKDLESMGIPADQIEMMEQQIQEYWALPWYGVLLGDFERVFAITAHIALTVLVLQCFLRRGRILWLFLAILFHAGLDFLAVLLTTMYPIYIAELVIACWSLSSVDILWHFYQQQDTADEILVLSAYSEVDDISGDSSTDEDSPAGM